MNNKIYWAQHVERMEPYRIRRQIVNHTRKEEDSLYARGYGEGISVFNRRTERTKRQEAWCCKFSVLLSLQKDSQKALRKDQPVRSLARRVVTLCELH